MPEETRKPILSLGGTKRLDMPDERHQVVVELQKWGIESPEWDLQWLQTTLGPLWRWTAVGAAGQLIESPGRRHGLTIQGLLGLVPALRQLSLCEGFQDFLRGFVERESFEASRFELAIALRAVQCVGPFRVRLSPPVKIGASIKRPDLSVGAGSRPIWVECKSVNGLSGSVKARLNRFAELFRQAVERQGIRGPPTGACLLFNVGDGNGAERLVQPLIAQLKRAVLSLGWEGMLGQDIDSAGVLRPGMAVGDAHPKAIGIRPPWEAPLPVNRLHTSTHIDWLAWQSRKVRELIHESLDQLPSGEPRLICIETPNPERHLHRAQNWIERSPLGDNSAVLLMDMTTGVTHHVSRLHELDHQALIG